MLLTETTAFDSETQNSYYIPLKTVTLIGGLINFSKPTVIQFIERQAKEKHPESRAILVCTKKTEAWLTVQYKETIKSSQESIFLSFLQVYDKAIRGVEIKENRIKMYREDTSEFLYTGSDSLRRIAIMALTLLNSKLLIIDEIESRLHHSYYTDLWFKLFETAYDREAQIIATTHSKEMIEVFARSALRYDRDNSGSPNTYIEIARSARTGNLIAVRIDADTVLYALERNQNIRGEL